MTRVKGRANICSLKRRNSTRKVGSDYQFGAAAQPRDKAADDLTDKGTLTPPRATLYLHANGPAQEKKKLNTRLHAQDANTLALVFAGDWSPS
jgi:hypothetical protein